MGEYKKNGQKVSIVESERAPLLWPEDVESWFERTMGGFGVRPMRHLGGWPRMWCGEGWLLPEIDVLQRENEMVV